MARHRRRRQYLHSSEAGMAFSHSTRNHLSSVTDSSNNVRPSIFANSHAQNNTGLALSSGSDGTDFAYYMDEGSNIVEAEYRNGTWLEPGGQPANVNNVTSEAAQSSPIAAICYTYNYTEYRQIFFYTPAGSLPRWTRRTAAHGASFTTQSPTSHPGQRQTDLQLVSQLQLTALMASCACTWLPRKDTYKSSGSTSTSLLARRGTNGPN